MTDPAARLPIGPLGMGGSCPCGYLAGWWSSVDARWRTVGFMLAWCRPSQHETIRCGRRGMGTRSLPAGPGAFRSACGDTTVGCSGGFSDSRFAAELSALHGFPRVGCSGLRVASCVVLCLFLRGLPLCLLLRGLPLCLFLRSLLRGSIRGLFLRFAGLDCVHRGLERLLSRRIVSGVSG